VRVTSYPVGYLASYVTELTGCGGPFTPWLIEAQHGQTIQLTLFNFSQQVKYTDVNIERINL